MSHVLHLKHAIATPVLALGAEMKSTICCAHGRRAMLSEPLPDLADAECFTRFEELVQSMPDQCGVAPRVLAYDCHPAYLSSKYARRADVLPGIPRVAVQHHEAHIAACAAGSGVETEALGLAFDGTGYGKDGTLWGGEVFRGSLARGFTRFARFRQMALPGGSAAIREPWRLACALVAAACDDVAAAYSRPENIAPEAWRVVLHMLADESRCPVRSSSVGRLFDGVSALLGLCPYAAQEAEAAIALEHAAASGTCREPYELPWAALPDGLIECDWRPMIRAIIADIHRRRAVNDIAACFHASVVSSVAQLCGEQPRPRSGIVLAGGGVFWNTLIREGLRDALPKVGLQLVLPEALPPSDASVSLGQAVLAGGCLNHSNGS